jgi:hypothetical protein
MRLLRARVSQSTSTICCQVPSASEPLTTGTVSEGPMSADCRCAAPLSSCQVLW